MRISHALMPPCLAIEKEFFAAAACLFAFPPVGVSFGWKQRSGQLALRVFFVLREMNEGSFL